jgi:hypothetical protein
MYDFILEEKLATVITMLLLAFLTSALVGAGRLWFKGLLYSASPALAASFYAIAFWATPQPNLADLIAGLLFELTVLALFFRLLLMVKQNIILICEEDAKRVLKWSVILQLLISYPNMSAVGFGLFSEGTRIDYLSASSMAKYYTYAGLLIISVQAVFLASLVMNRSYLGILGWSIIAINFTLSVLAGSKGAAFLWLLSIASLIEYKHTNIRIYKVIPWLVVGISAASISSIIIADFLKLDIFQFIDLVASRFFLTNDARALSLDLRTAQTIELSLFSEAFRSLGNLFGLPPKNAPLGVILYSEGLLITDGSGANASFMALATYYFPIGYSLIPALLGILGLVIFFGVARISTKLLVRPTLRLVAASIWLASLLSYSQDFLAFQIVFPLAALTVLAFWIIRQKSNYFPAKPQHVKL